MILRGLAAARLRHGSVLASTSPWHLYKDVQKSVSHRDVHKLIIESIYMIVDFHVRGLNMSDNKVVPDPKSGRDNSPQNTNAEKHYMSELTIRARKNEIRKLQAELVKIREAMSEAQTIAGIHRHRYDFVAMNVKEALRASRQAHRDVSRLLAFLRLETRGEEE